MPIFRVHLWCALTFESCLPVCFLLHLPRAILSFFTRTASRKLMGAHYRNVRYQHQLEVSGVRAPLMACFDFLGFRVLVSAEDEQPNAEVLYGLDFESHLCKSSVYINHQVKDMGRRMGLLPDHVDHPDWNAGMHPGFPLTSYCVWRACLGVLLTLMCVCVYVCVCAFSVSFSSECMFLPLVSCISHFFCARLLFLILLRCGIVCSSSVPFSVYQSMIHQIAFFLTFSLSLVGLVLSSSSFGVLHSNKHSTNIHAGLTKPERMHTLNTYTQKQPCYGPLLR
jgi:Clustered mitochondria